MVSGNARDLVKAMEECGSHARRMTKADLIDIIASKLKFPWART